VILSKCAPAGAKPELEAPVMIAKGLGLLVCALMLNASPVMNSDVIPEGAEQADQGSGMACTDSMVTEPYTDEFDLLPVADTSDARCEAPQMPVSI
jgi:hypothetical protein